MSDVASKGGEHNPAAQFFQALFLEAPGGQVVLWEKQGKSSRAFDVDELEAAAARASEWAATRDVYVERGLQQEPPVSGARGTAAGVAFVGGLFADIDTLEGAHAATKLPATADEALGLIQEAGLPVPTLTVHTGGGVHAHWLFDAPATLTTEEERTAAKALSEAWQRKLRAPFTARGYKLDSTADLCRLVRIPGTLNHKEPTAPKPVRVLSTGPRITLAQARELVADKLKGPTRTRKPASGGIAGRLAEERRKKLAEQSKRPEIASILAGCAFMERADAEADQLTEPEWYAALSIVGRCRDGERLAHEMSSPHQGYLEAETAAKLKHALEDAGPALCSRIAGELACAACQRCPFFGTITSPISLGHQPLSIVRVQRQTVYDVPTQRYLDVGTGAALPYSAFAGKVRAEIGRNPHDKLTGSKTLPKVEGFDYRPGDSRLVLCEPDGTKRANIWQPSGVTPVAGDASPILDHFNYLIPDEATRRHLLDYVAHLLQRPGDKIGHGVMLVGGFGVGKSTVARILTALIGPRNTTKLEGEELASRWTARLVNTQVLVVEEAAHGERYETYERLKELITGEMFTVEEKHIPRYPGRTPRGLLLVSNHDAPMVLPLGDRRFFVAATTETPAGVDYFRKLNAALTDAAHGVFADWLLRRDLSQFDAKAPPPMTEAKARATEASRTPLAQVLGHLIEGRSGAFARDVLSIESIAAELRRQPHFDIGKPTPERIAAALKAVGGLKREGVVRVPGGHARLWAIRNVDRFRSASAEEWRAEYIGKESEGAAIFELPAAITRAAEAVA